MAKLFSVLKYVKGYWRYASLNILFNILFSVLAVFSIALVIPFMDLLFKTDDQFYLDIIRKGKPEFSISIDYLKNSFNLFIALQIVSFGKASAIIFICISVFVLTFLKNASRYMAMYFVAPIRNGVVRDLRNRIFKKSLELPLSYYSNER